MAGGGTSNYTRQGRALLSWQEIGEGQQALLVAILARQPLHCCPGAPAAAARSACSRRHSALCSRQCTRLHSVLQ